MIYFNFIIDYIVSLLTPFNSYLIVNHIEENKLIDVIIVSCLIDLLFRKPPLNLLILLIIFLFSKRFIINKKYTFIKDIISFVIYFNVSFFVISFDLSKYWFYFIVGFGFNMLYSLFLFEKHKVI